MICMCLRVCLCECVYVCVHGVRLQVSVLTCSWILGNHPPTPTPRNEFTPVGETIRITNKTY